MGLFDFLTGTRAPPSGVKRKSTAGLRKDILAINRATAPFVIRDGKTEGIDMVAEWRVVDAKWYEIFAKAGIKKVFKVLMRFDEAKGEVRAVDEQWEIEWRAGLPTLTASGSASRGQKWEKSFEMVYAFREDGSYGEVYNYRFDTSEIKKPLREAVLAAGWGWRGVTFGKL